MTALDVILDDVAEQCRKAVPFDSDAHALLVAALGASEATVELARRIVTATMEATKVPPADPKPNPPPPPPPPPPTDVSIPPWLRSKIDEAEAAARDMLTQAGHLAARWRAIDEALVEINRLRGGDDRSFDQLGAATDRLSGFCQDIADVVTGIR